MTLRTDISVLYCDPRGPYPGLVADWWDEKRDAKLYAGPNPVVAHPPCGWWGKLAPVNSARYGRPVGDDGGCFAAALAAVRRWGGVLEHPALTHAWPRFGLLRPTREAWTRSLTDAGWVCEVSQAAYGHRAAKATWLYAFGLVPSIPNWSRPPATARCSNLRNRGGSDLPALRSREASETPVAFAEWLISLAALARRTEAA